MNWQEIFVQLLKISLAASVVALLVMILRLLFRKAPRWLICSLWLLVALRLLIPQLPGSSISVMPAAVSSGSVVSEVMEQYTSPEILPIREEDSYYPIIMEQSAVLPRQDRDGSRYVMINLQTGEVTKTLGETLLPILTPIWAGGVLCMLAYLVWSTLRIRKKTRFSVPQEGHVYFCDEAGAPFVFGLFRPRIYLPSHLSEEALACVLAHEQAHIARRDPFWKLLGYLLLSLHWFNPVLWISYLLLGRDIEKACDERAIRGRSMSWRKSYSAALLALSTPKSLLGACPVAFSELDTKSRVRAALTYRKPARWAVVLMTILALVAAGCALTNPTTTVQTESTETVQTNSDTALTNSATQETGDIFRVMAWEGDAAAGEWVFCFSYHDYPEGDKIPGNYTGSWYHYSYYWINFRYWDAALTEDTAALKRDEALIDDLLFNQKLSPRELLALNPEDYSFEVLDKEQFFRLMRQALTATPSQPEKRESFDQIWSQEKCREPIFRDGYRFKMAYLGNWGNVEEAFLDIALGDEKNYQLLSDLVESGSPEATKEMKEAYALLRQIAAWLTEGRDVDFTAHGEDYKNRVIGQFDFSRLYEMLLDMKVNPDERIKWHDPIPPVPMPIDGQLPPEIESSALPETTP